MDIINKLYESREDELHQITQQDRTELLKNCPKYYEDSNLESLVRENKELETAFETYSYKLSIETFYLCKKAYFTGIKDGIDIMKFIKGEKIDD